MAFSGNEVTRLGISGYSQVVYGSFAGKAASPPVFSGTISDISVKVNSGTTQYDYSSYYSGVVDSYSIDPAVPAGWSFNTSTGVLTVVPSTKGEFGPFTVTATNTGGTADSNAFNAAVTEAGAGASPRAKKARPRTIMVDGQVHAIEYPEQEYFILQAYLDKIRAQQELDLLKKKVPAVKRKIKVGATKIRRTENRLKKVEAQLKWRKQLRRNDEQLLALLAA